MKLNAEFNKLLKTVGHRASYFSETILTLFGYFLSLTYQVLKL